MKQLCVTLLAALLSATVVAQQQDTAVEGKLDKDTQVENYKDLFNTWSVGLAGGTSQFYGDVREYDWYPAKEGSFKELRYGLGVHAHKALNTIYGIQFDLVRGGMAGLRRQAGACEGCSPNNNQNIDTVGLKFEGDYWMTGMGLTLNLSNLFISGKGTHLEATRKWNFLVKVGVGRMYYRSVRTILGSDVIARDQFGEAFYRGYDDLGRTIEHADDLEKKSRVIETAINAGLSVRYRMSDQLDLSFSIDQLNSQTDRLDGDGNNKGETKDFVVFSALGVSYKLGSKKQSLEWYSLIDEVYHRQRKANKQVEGLTKDSDGDGIADQFDQNPNTPDGVAVDGGGNALDVDMDGVADYLDIDPFSNKGAAVDEFGKELDNDGDGIPNSRDLEPNTEPGAVVTYQGITLKGMGGVSSSFLPSIFFASGAANLRHQELKQLATVAKTLRNNPDLTLQVIGHADSQGDVYVNHQLGLDRAEKVISHLVDVYGVDRARLMADSKGETQPLALTPAIQVEIEGRGITLDDYLSEINRRVDFEIAE